MEKTTEIGADLLMIALLLFVLLCRKIFIWIKYNFIGFKSKPMLCKHKRKDREYYGDYSFGILGSKFQKFECKRCGKKFESQDNRIIGKVAS